MLFGFHTPVYGDRALVYIVELEKSLALSSIVSSTMVKRARGARKAAKRVSKGGKRSRKPKRSFKTFIGRVLRHSNKGLTLSSRAAKILNSFVNDMFDRLATQAAALTRYNKTRTMKARDVATAVRLTLPAELAKHSVSEATKATTSA